MVSAAGRPRRSSRSTAAIRSTDSSNSQHCSSCLQHSSSAGALSRGWLLHEPLQQSSSRLVGMLPVAAVCLLQGRQHQGSRGRSRRPHTRCSQSGIRVRCLLPCRQKASPHTPLAGDLPLLSPSPAQYLFVTKCKSCRHLAGLIPTYRHIAKGVCILQKQRISLAQCWGTRTVLPQGVLYTLCFSRMCCILHSALGTWTAVLVVCAAAVQGHGLQRPRFAVVAVCDGLCGTCV
jgi:hypothetical protein